jgi:hypothetical protein
MGKKFGFIASATVMAGFGSALLLAPAASALPQCVTTAPYTTQCTTGGSTQIITSPPLVSSSVADRQTVPQFSANLTFYFAVPDQRRAHRERVR